VIATNLQFTMILVDSLRLIQDLEFTAIYISNSNYGIFPFIIVRYIALIPLQRGNLTEGFPH